MIKNFIFQTIGVALVGTFLRADIARAQVPPPAPPLVTSQLRQQLRAEILRTARATEARYSNTRPTLALPLAQLGDWKTALRWTAQENDVNTPRQADILWHWRATQLARAGKWSEVAPAAAHLSRPELRADLLLFAARQMLERGARLHTPLEQSRQLESLLNLAAPLLATASPAQQSYRAYLYAHGGDVVASRRIFARVLPQAERADARARELKKSAPHSIESMMNRGNNVNSVLTWQVSSGLLSDTVRYSKTHLDSVDDISIGWWMTAAHTSDELESLANLVARLPLRTQTSSLYQLAITNANLGHQKRAIAQFQEARRLMPQALEAVKPNKSLTSDKQRDLALNARARATYMALLTALAIKDDELIAQTKSEIREIVEAMPKESNFIKTEDFPILAPTFELTLTQNFGGETLTPARLTEISAQLRAAPPSEMQFNALETLAAYFYGRKNNGELLTVAQTMLSTARALQTAERAKRAAEKNSIINPYWPQSPRVLNSIFWLQRAGDAATAAQFARGFAQNVPAKERPYAALALTQLGFFDLADQVFDPKLEIPRVAAQQATNWKTNRVDWSLFTSWGDFAANQARFRVPDAPFRWIDKIENPDNRAHVLSAWVSALFPVAPDQTPYVRVTPSGSSSTIAGYAGTG